MGTINLPAIGEVKTGYVVAGGVVVTVIVGWAWYRHIHGEGAVSSSSGGNSSSAGTSTATPYSSGMGTNTISSDIDPLTGYEYGSEADQDALASLYGGSAVDTSDTGSTGVTTTSTGTTTSASGSTITTNNAWLQNIVDTNDTPYTSAQIIQACSAWFAGQQITTTEQTIIQTCEALYGAPPQALPAPNVGTPNSGSGGGSGSSGTGSTGTLSAPTGLQVHSSGATSVVVEWLPVSGASSYTIQVTPKDASSHNIGARTSYNVGGLKKNTSYVAHVAASGGPTASVSFKTGS